MKVAHLTSVHPVYDIRIFHKECSTLAQSGYEVSLIAVHDETILKDSVKIIGIPRPRGRFSRMTLTACYVFLAALREGADIYHIHDAELLPWGQVLRLLGKRVVFDMHENLVEDIRTRPWLPPMLGRVTGWMLNCLAPFLLANIPVVFAESSYIKHYPWVKRSVVVLNMPLLDRLLPVNERKNADFTLGYLGSVSELRGSMNTLRAMRILKKRGYKIIYECVGPVSETDQREMLNLASEYQLEVRLHGYLRADEGWRLMARCHVGLAVLLPRPNYIESYPTKLFEYMALGLPVIVSSFPLYREVVSSADCGLCVNPENPAELADAIERLISNPSWARKLGENGRLGAQEQYSWKNESSKLLEFYEDVLRS
jgi:glycosyltransferase involved in cell wall biosynthesis